MNTVADILRAKGSAAVHSVLPHDSMLHALRRMAEHDVGALLVLDDAGMLAGIVSERDYARKIALHGRNSERTPVGEIMTTDVHCVTPGHSSQQCMELMTRWRIRHLPVLEAPGQQLLGLISIGDIVKAIIDAQQATIEHLEHFITGMPQPQG